jgi:hypothetical protein
MKKIIYLIIFLISLQSPVFAATYYIDFDTGNDTNAGTQALPWKYAPGMIGWEGSATLSNNDTVILKGGVTWTPAAHNTTCWTIPNATGLTIRGGQRLETPWGTGYPVLDSVDSTAANYVVYNTRTGLTFDGIKIINAGIATGGYGIGAVGAVSNLVIENCWFENNTDIDVWIAPSTDASSFTVRNNVFYRTRQGLTSYVDLPNSNVSGWYIYGNEFRGNAGGGASNKHGDGIMMGSNCTEANTCMSNIQIYHNKFFGDWSVGATALINLQNGGYSTTVWDDYFGGKDVLIHNNVIAIDKPAGISPGLIAIWSKWDNIKIYNNTFSSYFAAASPVTQGIALIGSPTNIDVKNNIFDGLTSSAVSGKSTSFTAIDYNFYGTNLVRYINGWTGSQDCRNLTTCCANFGQECHGKSGDPMFVTPPDNGASVGDWHLQAGSGAINKGYDLGVDYDEDVLGNARPETDGTLWDIGAYEYGYGDDPEVPPTIHTVTVSLTGTGGSLSVSGERSVIDTESISVTATRHNGWNGAWSGDCPSVLDCTVPAQGASETCTVTPTGACTMTYTATEIKLLN